MPDRAPSSDPDPLLAEIHVIAAELDPKDVAPPDLSDPALLLLVDRAVGPYEAALTPEGLDEAQQVATFALATHPDIEPVLARVRGELPKHGSGVRPTRSADRLAEVARQKSARGSR